MWYDIYRIYIPSRNNKRTDRMSSKRELREKTKLFPMMFSTFNIIVALYVQKLSNSRVRNAIIKKN